MTEALLSGLAASPDVYVQKIDLARGAALLVQLNESAYRAASFLDDRILTPDLKGAWVSLESVLGAAFYGGLMRPDRRYQVVRYEGSTIIFRDLEGTFTATFVPPSEPGEPWLLAELSQEPTSPDNLSSEDGEE